MAGAVILYRFWPPICGSSIFLKIDDDFIVSDSDILALPYPPGVRTIYFGEKYLEIVA